MKLEVASVWEAYRRHHPRAALTPDRERLIADRLTHYDAETLIRAIQGNHIDAFCCGANDRGKEYHSLSLILRDADHIERYAEVADEEARRVEMFDNVRVIGSRRPGRRRE